MESVDNNPLYPVFFKLNKLRILVIGAGTVAEEKLHFILKSSPNANITIVAPWARQNTFDIIEKYPDNINWIKKEFDETDISSNDLIIAATNFHEINKQVHKAAKSQGKIINVADTPELCDFYMGSIVTKGALKIAVSTNGQSPTLAKRFRQLLEDVLPDDTSSLISNLKKIRDNLKGDFEYKVGHLNDLTQSIVDNINKN
jgi:siroheme synthase-like protein